MDKNPIIFSCKKFTPKMMMMMMMPHFQGCPPNAWCACNSPPGTCKDTCVYFHQEDDLIDRLICVLCGENRCSDFVCIDCTSKKSSKASMTCRFEAAGDCKFGDRCLFHHETSPDRPICECCQASPCKPDEKFCWVCHKALVQRYEHVGCRFARSYRHDDEQSKRRGCRYGDSCYLDHELMDRRPFCQVCHRHRVAEPQTTCQTCENFLQKQDADAEREEEEEEEEEDTEREEEENE